MTILGRVRVGRAYYHCQHCHAGNCPRDTAPGLTTADLSRGATEAVALAGALGSFAGAAQKVLPKLSGLHLSESTVERATGRTGEEVGSRLGRGQTFGEEKAWRWSKDARGEAVAYVSADSTGVGMQGDNGRATAGRMAAVGVAWHAGQPGQVRYVCGLAGGLKALGDSLRSQGAQVGMDRARRWVAISDGGAGIEDWLRENFPRVEAVVLDFYHVAEYLGEWAKVPHPEEAGASRVAEGWCHRLKHEGGEAVLADLRQTDVSSRCAAVREAHRVLLDHLARTAADPRAVVRRFADRAGKVSTPVLLQVMTHFRRRPRPGELRAFFPKGQVGNLFATTEPLPELPAGVAEGLAAVCERALLDRFAKLPPLGKCYLDLRLAGYLVPFSQRSASKALRTLVRGSRLPLPDCTTLRFFVWWRNGRSRVDIDLSAAMYDADYQYVDTLAYYNLKNFGAHHSGDVTDAPRGAAEFIDVDVARCLEKKVRYVVMVLNSYTEQPYRDLPECFAGWMGRQEPASGEVFEPKTVADKVDVASDTRICLPAVFDLAGREVVWADIALAKHPRFVNNVHNNLSGVSLMLRAVTQLRKTELHTLFDLHVRARGERVADPEGAETVFAVDRGLTPFDLDRIAAEYL